MTTHAAGRPAVEALEAHVWHGHSTHWAWLAGDFALAFAAPFLLADLLAMNRDLFYGI